MSEFRDKIAELMSDARETDIIMTEAVADEIRENSKCPICESDMEVLADNIMVTGYKCHCGRIYLLDKNE